MKIPLRKRLLFLTACLFLLGPWLHPATAQPQGPQFQVNTYTTSSQRGPAVAADGSGNLVVVRGTSSSSDRGASPAANRRSTAPVQGAVPTCFTMA